MTATEPFTELLQPTKTERNRVIRWEPSSDGLWSVGVLTIEDSRETTKYVVDETATDAGRAFTLRKPGEGFYCVNVRGFAADSCECKRFTKTGAVCRHIEAMRVLIANDQI